MNLSELLAGFPVGFSVRGETAAEISSLASHSASVRPGALFFALPGTRHDGSEFALEAIEKGAVALAAGKFLEMVPPRVPQVVFAEPVPALSALADRFYDYPGNKLQLIGVTGTNGKTTVSWLIRRILQEQGRPCGLIGTIRYLVGDRSLPAALTTPGPPYLQELLAGMVKAGSTHAVMETSSHALSQGRLRGLSFRLGVFTNLTPDHLDYHGNLSVYGKAKARLFWELLDREKGTAVLNADDPLTPALAAAFPGRILTYGLENRAEIKGEEIRLDAGGSSFRVCFQGRRYPARIPLPGRYNVANVLAALGAAFALGVEPERSLSALEGCPPIPGRMEPVGTGGGVRVLVDFAHTPDALENALKALREIAPSRLILVFGCGGDRDRLKRPLMGEIASRLADFTVITSDNPRSEDPGEIIAEIARGIPASRGNYSIRPEREAAIREAVSLAADGDIVLIAGKGHEEKQIFADREVPFSDRRVAEAALSEKGGGL